MNETVSEDPRVKMLREVIRPGDSFLDVGGVEKNEMITTAAAFGATELEMMDARPLDDPLWGTLREKWTAAGLHTRRWSWKIEQFAGRQWDVVHCGSVLHHVTDVPRTLAGLRLATRRDCILTAMTVGREYAKGIAEIMELVGPDVPGLTAQRTGGIEDWQHVPTDAALASMIDLAGFVFVRVRRHWHDHLVTMHLT